MTIGLTHRQRDLLVYLQSRGPNDPPSLREIGEALGMKNGARAHALVDRLQERGWVRHRRHHARSIEVIRPLPISIHGEAHRFIAKVPAEPGRASAATEPYPFRSHRTCAEWN